ncbi:MAG TPA: ClC family H(+)/Cl(-) exchange transporter [Peptococcaceae bacterium]|nr:ClC family H(+)/Cl(-) exchange transporter [Peptococcaceae bacterium]
MRDIFLLLSGKNFRLKIFFEGVFTGICVGLVISAFRFLLERAENLRVYSYQLLAGTGFLGLIIRFAALVLVAGLISLIISKAPQTAGSGIVQVKGFLLGQVKLKWARNLIGKFFGTIIAIGAGLSLGRQGPSVQIGASVGQGVSRLLGRLRVEEKYLVTCGAGAGLAAAFNAPLAGVVFALEEVHKSFSPAALLSTMGAALSADFVMRQFFGPKPVLDFSGIPILPQSHFWALLGLGLCCGLVGALFNKVLVQTYKLYGRLRTAFPFLPSSWFPLAPLFIAGILGFFLPQVLGGGESFILSLAGESYLLSFLLLLLVVKFLFTMLCAASGAPGGIFLPMLVIGALVGGIFGQVLAGLNQVSPDLIPNFVVFAMAALFTAVVKAPITGSILIVEMTGSFQHLLPVIITCMVAYLVSDLLRISSIYDDLLQLTIIAPAKAAKEKAGLDFGAEGTNLSLERNNQAQPGGEEQANKFAKTIIEEVVCQGSRLEGQKVKNIKWPESCLVVSIRRGEEEIIPQGNTRMLAGDFLYLFCPQAKEDEVRLKLKDLCQEDTKNCRF